MSLLVPAVCLAVPGTLICLAAVPNSPLSIMVVHWNGPAMQFDNQHRPFIHVQVAELRDVIVDELTDRKGIASNGSCGER